MAKRNRATAAQKQRRAERRDSGRSNNSSRSQAKERTQKRESNRTPEQKAENKAKKQQTVSNASEYDYNAYKKGSVNSGEISAMRKQGISRNEIQESIQNSGMKIGKATQNRLNRWDSQAQVNQGVEPHTSAPTTQPINENSNANVNEEQPSVPTHTPTSNVPADLLTPKTPSIPKSSPFNNNEVEQVQDQTVSQDNDINSSVNGDNNVVDIRQDNSVRQYGGVNKSFIYNGSANGKNYMDTPVSAGTMGGYFHEEDSPSRSAAFVDRYMTMNNDYQKQFDNTNHAQSAISKAFATTAVDVNALDARINDRAKANRARSTAMAGDIFGDMYNYSPEEFEI